MLDGWPGSGPALSGTLHSYSWLSPGATASSIIIMWSSWPGPIIPSWALVYWTPCGCIEIGKDARLRKRTRISSPTSARMIGPSSARWSSSSGIGRRVVKVESVYST